MRSWYWFILLIWAFTGLPMLVLGIGFAGPEVFTPRGLVILFTPPLSYGAGEFLWWICGWMVIAIPLWAAPLARRRLTDQSSN
jgi:hypothetical protein